MISTKVQGRCIFKRVLGLLPPINPLHLSRQFQIYSNVIQTWWYSNMWSLGSIKGRKLMLSFYDCLNSLHIVVFCSISFPEKDTIWLFSRFENLSMVFTYTPHHLFLSLVRTGVSRWFLVSFIYIGYQQDGIGSNQSDLVQMLKILNVLEYLRCHLYNLKFWLTRYKCGISYHSYRLAN